MWRAAFFLLVFAAIVGGCSRSSPSGLPVTYVDDDDPQMKAAIEKARATLPDFVRALQSPKPSQRGFSIKTPITDGTHTEHMWLQPVTFDGKQYRGTVDNQPEKVTGVKLGSIRSIDPHQVTDWMYIDNGKLVGGYTIRVVREKLGPKERDDFDKNAPFVLDRR
jgi:uncharacterized protein YegJ (DUF2314 family)